MRTDFAILAQGFALTLPQFKDCDFATTLLGKLFIDLAGETAWSSDYVVSVSFNQPMCLTITHQAFPAGAPLVIEQSDWVDWTVRRVEDAVREHLDKEMQTVRAKIEPLLRQICNMDDALGRIDKAKARAALAAAFPEAAEFAQFSPEPTDVFCFGSVMDHTPTYLVRMINHESVGVARVSDQSPLGWHMLPDGIGKNQRLGQFWTALAKSFAARELEIPEENLLQGEVRASEKTWDPTQADRFVVDKVILPVFLTGRRVHVTFGCDNLPAKAELFVPTQAVDS